jgi:hypothetical protein
MTLAIFQAPSILTMSKPSMPQWLILPSCTASKGAQTIAMVPRCRTTGL